MVVKSVRGRRRYIVFSVPEGTGRSDLLAKLSDAMERMPDVRVITCFSGKAIVRCGPAEIQEITTLMKVSFQGCESLITSGTLRTIRDRYPELKVPRKKKR